MGKRKWEEAANKTGGWCLDALQGAVLIELELFYLVEPHTPTIRNTGIKPLSKHTWQIGSRRTSNVKGFGGFSALPTSCWIPFEIFSNAWGGPLDSGSESRREMKPVGCRCIGGSFLLSFDCVLLSRTRWLHKPCNSQASDQTADFRTCVHSFEYGGGVK